ncbi:MAG: FtsQ-type POTRA domain-containing protein [Deltaproteobacteria bacterium]|nr:MAG: FtsQ-type POTRA domain-containing protein [Deltaproteobacteria bacterium]
MKRKTKKKFNIIKKKHAVVAGVVVSFLAFSGVALVAKPPAFLCVQEVIVPKPLKHLKELDVVKLSGVKKGQSLLTLSLETVRENILRYPWVKEVTLSKRIPGRLSIEVEEQTPVALLEMSSEKTQESGLYLINAEGKVFKKLESGDSKDLPLITGLTKEEIRDHLNHYVRVLSWFQGEEFDVSELNWRDGDLTLFTQDPCIQISFGKDTTEDLNVWLSRKARLLEAWPTIKTATKTPRAIDLTLERRIIVKQKILAGNN